MQVTFLTHPTDHCVCWTSSKVVKNSTLSCNKSPRSIIQGFKGTHIAVMASKVSVFHSVSNFTFLISSCLGIYVYGHRWERAAQKIGNCWSARVAVVSTLMYSILTILHTPWSRVLEKLTSFQLVKKFPAFCGTRRFITAFTSARHLSLSWASLIQFIPPHPTSWRSILILSPHLRLGLPSGLFLSGFPTKTLHTPLPHTRYMPRPCHSYRFYHPNNIGWGVQNDDWFRYG